MSELPSWERQPFETQKAWEAFKTYRDLGAARSISAVQQALGRPIGYRCPLEKWSYKNNWVERCKKYDAHCDRIDREALRQSAKERYLEKITQHKETKERLARALTQSGAKVLSILQTELTNRINNPTPMSGAEIAALLRATIVALKIGFQLTDEALRCELAELQTTSVENTDFNNDDDADAEELVRRYFQVINEINAEY